MATTARNRYVVTKPRNDAYTGLLFISLLALLTSCVLLYLDYSQYGTQKPAYVPSIPKAGPGVSLPAGGGDAAPSPAPMEPAPMAPGPMAPGPMAPGAPPAPPKVPGIG